MRPNVLLVVLDAARQDAVAPYGPTGSTPTIADLSRRGGSFPSAYATGCWTLPSHASMFSGKLPRALGVTQLGAGESYSAARPRLERQRERWLPEVLRRAGYRTRCVTTNLHASHHVGFDMGFEDYVLLNESRLGLLQSGVEHGKRAALAWVREGLRAKSDDGARAAGEVLRGWIGADRGRPTFWFVNLLECHSPYLPPRPWNDLPILERARAALEARRYTSFEASCRICAGQLEVPDETYDRMRYLYHRAIAYMDDWLAGVLETLDRRGILEETLVIVTSDHGENLGEGGLVQHGFSLDERLIHVPLVLAGPGATVHEGPFSLASLPRLIAEAAGLPEHPWPVNELPAGAAVAQFDPPAPADHPAMKQFVSKWGIDEHGSRRLTGALTCATDGRRKLLLRDDVAQLYDLVADPLEESPAHADNADDLWSALGHPSVAAVAGPSEAEEPSAAPDAEVEALERQMKLLGYM